MTPRTSIRLGRLSISSTSHCIDDPEELIPVPLSQSRVRSILSEQVICDFLVSPTPAHHESDVSNASSFQASGVTCLFQKTICPNAKKTIILFHDGHERATDYFGKTDASKIRSLLLHMGFDVSIITVVTKGSFNLTDVIESTVPNLVRTLAKSYKSQDMIVFGRGVLGCILATDFTSRQKGVGALVLESSTSDLFSILTGDNRIMERINTAQDSAKQNESKLFLELLKEATAYNCDTLSKLSKFKGKLILLHSKLDERVPLSHAEKLFQSCPSKHKGLFIFDQGSHGKLFSSNTQQYVSAFMRLCEMLSHVVPLTLSTFTKELFQSFDDLNFSDGDCATVHTCDETTEGSIRDFIYVDDDDQDDECDLSYVTVGQEEEENE